MKHCQIDPAGHPIAFFDDAIHKTIPDDAFEISERAWMECVANPGLRRFHEGKLVECVMPSAPPMSSAETFDARIACDPVLEKTIAVLSEAISQVIDFSPEEARERIIAGLEER